jgi:biopolymer transport protein ExbD
MSENTTMILIFSTYTTLCVTGVFWMAIQMLRVVAKVSAFPLDALKTEQKTVTVSMDGEGRIFLDDQELAPGELSDRLAGLAADGPAGKPPLVTLRADRSLDYGRVVAVMGALNAAGFKSISLVTNGSVSAP